MIRPEDWQPIAELSLEPNALAAIREKESNVIIAAGPGAGKTELLAQRADFLFRTGISPYPRRILAISFKVDSARNLQARVRLRSGEQHAARFDSFTFHAFAKRLTDNYRSALTGMHALERDYRVDRLKRIQGEQVTFDDLVPLASEILSSNRYALGALRQTYSHVLLDEFQDATESQYDLICQAFGGTMARLTAVGDVKQSIMAFAGALDGVMASFASDFGATQLQLYHNFRSKPQLRRMQNRMILDIDPNAATPDEDIRGEEGAVRLLSFDTDILEASAIADLVRVWLNDGVPPSEIAVLVRQQPHLVAAELMLQLSSLSIPHRNEQLAQDLNAEPVAALVFNLLRVVADNRQPNSYRELFRVATRGSIETTKNVLESRLHKFLSEKRRLVRSSDFDRSRASSWEPLVSEFLELVTTPSLRALSPSYQQGTRLDDIIYDAFSAFERELLVDGDPVLALSRLSENDAVRILTIHKCKGLEFEKVIVIGVETQLFWGPDFKAEFFVAISRAKSELVLTHSEWRSRRRDAPDNWRENRNAFTELLGYAHEV